MLKLSYLSKYAGILSLLAVMAVSALPQASLAQDKYLPGQSSASVNFAGTVTAIDPSANSLSAEVRWFFGFAAGSTASYSQLTIPVGGFFCPGKIISVVVPSNVSIISFAGQPITLSQVPVGAYFRATATWQNGVVTATVLRFSLTAHAPPTLPPGTILPPIKTSYNTAPLGSGSVRISGSVTTVNAPSNTFSAEIKWFYGGAMNQSQTILLPIAGRLCPGTVVPVQVMSGTNLVNASGYPITLDQVSAGNTFIGTITWQNGVYTANVIKFFSGTDALPQPPPPPTPPPLPPPGTPTLSLSASPSTITPGQSSTLTWSSANATTCTASEGWVGTKALSGTESVSPTVTTTYTLTCTGTAGSAIKSASVSVGTTPPPPPPPPPPSPGPIYDGASVQTSINLNIRSAPTTVATSLGKAPTGSTGVVRCPQGVACPAYSYGYKWWYIDWDPSSLQSGWSAEGSTEATFLTLISGQTPPPTVPPTQPTPPPTVPPTKPTTPACGFWRSLFGLCSY